MPPQVVNPLRTAFVLAALAGGCVIPVGPKWEDPEPNYPPYVVSSNPTVGEIFTPGTTDQDRELTVMLSDENVNDNLAVRFLIDYPGTDTSTARLFYLATLAPTGEPDRGPLHMRPQCNIIGIGPGMHRMMMAVSDRPFLDALTGDDVDPEAPLDSVPSEAKRIRASWFLNCPGAAQ